MKKLKGIETTEPTFHEIMEKIDFWVNLLRRSETSNPYINHYITSAEQCACEAGMTLLDFGFTKEDLQKLLRKSLICKIRFRLELLQIPALRTRHNAMLIVQCITDAGMALDYFNVSPEDRAILAAT